jgi:hypothetical protein
MENLDLTKQPDWRSRWRAAVFAVLLLGAYETVQYLSKDRTIEINQPDLVLKTDWNSIDTVVDPKTGRTFPMTAYYYRQLIRIRQEAEQTRNELAAKAFMENQANGIQVMCMEVSPEKLDMDSRIQRAENNQLPTKASPREIEGEVICVPEDRTKQGSAVLGLDHKFNVITAEVEDKKESNSKKSAPAWGLRKPNGGDL